MTPTGRPQGSCRPEEHYRTGRLQIRQQLASRTSQVESDCYFISSERTHLREQGWSSRCWQMLGIVSSLYLFLFFPSIVHENQMSDYPSKHGERPLEIKSIWECHDLCRLAAFVCPSYDWSPTFALVLLTFSPIRLGRSSSHWTTLRPELRSI